MPPGVVLQDGMQHPPELSRSDVLLLARGHRNPNKDTLYPPPETTPTLHLPPAPGLQVLRLPGPHTRNTCDGGPAHTPFRVASPPGPAVWE